MILAGITLNGTVFGLLLIPLQFGPVQSLNIEEAIPLADSNDVDSRDIKRNHNTNDDNSLLFREKTNAENSILEEETSQSTTLVINEGFSNTPLGDTSFKNGNIGSENKQTLIKNENCIKTNTQTGVHNRLRQIATSLSLDLLTDFRCLMFIISVFVLNMAYVIPFNLLPDMADRTGMSKHQGAWLVSTIGR